MNIKQIMFKDFIEGGLKLDDPYWDCLEDDYPETKDEIECLKWITRKMDYGIVEPLETEILLTDNDGMRNTISKVYTWKYAKYVYQSDFKGYNTMLPNVLLCKKLQSYNTRKTCFTFHNLVDAYQNLIDEWRLLKEKDKKECWKWNGKCEYLLAKLSSQTSASRLLFGRCWRNTIRKHFADFGTITTSMDMANQPSFYWLILKDFKELKYVACDTAECHFRYFETKEEAVAFYEGTIDLNDDSMYGI